MAISKCIKCENTIFEMVEYSPLGSNFKYNFIQCNRCGGVIGAVEYFNVGADVQRLIRKLNA